MLARIAATVVVLAVAVVALASSADAASLSGVPDPALHGSEMMLTGHVGEPSCVDRQCGSFDAGCCDYACVGLSVFLPSPNEEAGRDFGSATHHMRAGAILGGRTPGLSERPPKLRL